MDADSKGVVDFKEVTRHRVISREKPLVYVNPLRMQPAMASAKKYVRTSIPFSVEIIPRLSSPGYELGEGGTRGGRGGWGGGEGRG